MQFITFDLGLKSQIFEAERIWSHELPREAGQLGRPITQYVEGPPSGNQANVAFNQDFINFLKVRYPHIPFKQAAR